MILKVRPLLMQFMTLYTGLGHVVFLCRVVVHVVERWTLVLLLVGTALGTVICGAVGGIARA